MQARPPVAFHVLCKPVGAACNLACRYCFYLEKARTLDARPARMPLAVLERFIRDYVAAWSCLTCDAIPFGWQGGEPTLAGLDFFEQVVKLQASEARGRKVLNSLQTNGLLLDDRWCEFLARHGFLVGLSLDGPPAVHDLHRLGPGGEATCERVLDAARRLKAHGVAFNLLSVIHGENARRPLETWRLLKEAGAGFIQFIPLVERVRTREDTSLALPPAPGGAPGPGLVASYTVDPRDWGRFLMAVWDAWVREDVGRTSVQIFESALGHHAGLASSLCVYSETCGDALALEWNGDLYACDHYVDAAHRLGNVLEQDLATLARSDRQRRFGEARRDALSARCRACPHLRLCQGDCPKHRILPDPDPSLPGRSWLCEGYERFFTHAGPALAMMARLLLAGRKPAEVMGHPLLATPERWPGRHEPCPCGSGRSFKRCCRPA